MFSTETQPHLLHVFSTFDAGGPEIRAVEIMNALGRRARHTIVAWDGTMRAALRIQSNVPVDILPKLPITRCGVPLFGKARRWGEATVNIGAIAAHSARLLRAVNPDLLLTYGLYASPALLSASLLHKTPAVHFEDGFNADEREGFRRRRVWLRRLLLPFADRVVVPSSALERIVKQQRWAKCERIVRIANGVDTDRFTRERPRTSESPIVFGTVANVRREKRLDWMLSAFARLPKGAARLHIVGDGPCREEWVQLSVRLGIHEAVEWIGAVPDPARYLADMDVFLITSETEQMPVALLEAMASALPAIATNVGECSRMLNGEDCNHIVAPGDIEALASAMRAFLDSRELRDRSGRANRVRCAQHYSLTRMLNQHLAVYESLLENHGRR